LSFFFTCSVTFLIVFSLSSFLEKRLLVWVTPDSPRLKKIADLTQLHARISMTKIDFHLPCYFDKPNSICIVDLIMKNSVAQLFLSTV